MEKKKLQSVSIAALIVSILPLAALAPSLLHLSLSDGVRTAWAGANIVFVLLGLILSVVCVRSRESRSVINIVSTAISAFWALLMVGIVALPCPYFRSVRKRLCVEWETYWLLPDRGFFAGLYCLLRLDRLEQKAKRYYGNYYCKTDFDLVRKIKVIVGN